MQAYALYNDAYSAWQDEIAKWEKAEAIYVWAQKGMILAQEDDDGAQS